MQWLWLFLTIPIGWWVFKRWREASAEAALLIDSVVRNSLENLGYKPDEASLVFLARHPFLAARIWRMLGDGGAANSLLSVVFGGGRLSEETEESCERLLRFVRDKSFRARCPCAGALMQYAVYLCDRSPENRLGCVHPKDELLAGDEENV